MRRALSSLATAGWVLCMRSATSAWVSPAFIRARISSATSANSSASSAWDLTNAGSLRHSARNFSNGIVRALRLRRPAVLADLLVISSLWIVSRRCRFPAWRLLRPLGEDPHDDDAWLGALT